MHSKVLENCVHCNFSTQSPSCSRETYTYIKVSGTESGDDEIDNDVSISDAIFYIYGLSFQHLVSDWKSTTTSCDDEHVEIKREFPPNKKDYKNAVMCSLCVATFTELYTIFRNFTKLSSEESVLSTALHKWTRGEPLPNVKIENESDCEEGEHETESDGCQLSYPIVENDEFEHQHSENWNCSPPASTYEENVVDLPSCMKEEETVVRPKRRNMKNIATSAKKKKHLDSSGSDKHEGLKSLSIVLDRLDYKNDFGRMTGQILENDAVVSLNEIPPSPTKEMQRIPINNSETSKRRGKTVWRTVTAKKKKSRILRNLRKKCTSQRRSKSRSPEDSFLYVHYVICCDTQFTKKSEFLNHRQQCHLGKYLRESCTECEDMVLYHKMGEHVRHYHKTNNGTTYHCLFCNKIFLEELLLRQHAKTHSDAKICEGENPGEDQNSLESIGRVYITYKPLRNLVKNPPTKIPCVACDKLITKESMAGHMITHSSTRKTYKCSFCDKVYIQKSNLTCHERTHQDNFEHIVCELCGKKAEHVRALRHHMKHCHPGEDFPCKHCGKQLKSRQNLLRHEKVHLDIYPFVCERCGKPFHLKEKFDRHMRQHLDEELDKETFKCLECGKYLKDTLNLRKHMNRSHGPNRKLFSCPTCGKTTKNMTNMRIHQKVHDPSRNAKLPSQVKSGDNGAATSTCYDTIVESGGFQF